MNKGKFASLILLGAFSAGVASSSAVSAQGDENLASVVDNKSASSHDDSVLIDPKVSNEPVVAADETKIDTKTTTDEETQDVSPDDNSDAGVNAKNIDDNPENKTDLPENLDKEDNKNRDYLFVDKTKKVKKVNLAKGLAIAAGGGAALGGATFGISKLVKSSGNDKKDEPSPETNPESDKPTSSEEEEKEPEKKDEPSPETNPESDKPTGSEKEEKEPEKNPSEKPKEEEKVGFVEWFWTWYKNNLVVSIPLTILSVYLIQAIIRMIIWEIQQWEYKGIYFEFNSEANKNIKPLFGSCKNFTNENRFDRDKDYEDFTINYSGLKRIGINAIAGLTLAQYDWRGVNY